MEPEQKPKSDGLGFEWIVGMTRDFEEEVKKGMFDLTPERASYWQLRILLAMAQQLSVLVATVKERG